MRVCADCGSDNSADANFCSKCGARLEEDSSSGHTDGAAAGPGDEFDLAGDKGGGPGHAPQSGRVARPTIRDVARHSGVSRATVSRVLNGVQVRAPALAKVNQSIEELGFTVNQVARNLARGRTGSVAYVISDHREHLLEDPNFGVITTALSRELTLRRTHLLVTTAQSAEGEIFLGDYLVAGHVDGVLLALPQASDGLLERLIASHLPTVVIGRPTELQESISWVAADDEAAAYEVVRYLLSSGRSAVATITGLTETSAGRDRLAGYRRAVGRKASSRLVAHGDWSYATGSESTESLLGRGVKFDAIFAANDLMAAGAITVLRRAGLRVPEDVAVAGYDDSPAARFTDPPLTTVRNPFQEFAVEAVRILDDLISGRASKPTHAILPTELVVRASA
jgi:DNA-binding LacI/PurR family transcriptional regulator